jgi:type I restriction enzyme, S subunit
MQLDITAAPVFIHDDLAEETERFRLLPGDIVVSMTGTKYKRDYGNAALVDPTHGSLYLNQRVSRVRCGETLQPRFLLYWMQSDLFRQHFFAGETGNVNQGNVGADGIRKAPIELPPLAEQHEIVRRVEQLFALADRLEAQLAAARTRVDRLTQSILAKAFRGELVPTEADLARRESRPYEPASELLARIRQQPTATKPTKAPRKASKKSAE